ncbi:MAG: molecular chaperone DnaJ [Clostridiales bacterium]|jgi:molecular chaperone DnaJ|nr:molecular chaperone DnaJ [Clostridiales bacterium]
MADKKDYYETLGIQKGASDDEIKKAFRKMAKKYHPDANQNDKTAEAKFKEINEAYEILSDPQKKAQYDQLGHSAFENMGGGGGSYNYSGAGFDMSDIFESFFGGDFGDAFGGSSRRRNGPRRGADVQTRINITFEEAFFGATKTISVPMDEVCATCKGTGAKPGTFAETCKNCNGTGQERFQQQTMFGTMTSVRTCHVCHGEGKIIKDPCPTCGGKGKVRKSKTIEVNIPKGIDNGQSIRLSGKGEPGDKGGPNGDLLITIFITGHDYFKRQGQDIFLDTPISFVQATLGAEIDIPTMEGVEKYTVRPGTQPGTVVTLRGKGFPSVRNSRISGDMHITLSVKVPTKLNDRQKALLKEFAEASGDTFDDGKKNSGFFSKLKDKFEG